MNPLLHELIYTPQYSRTVPKKEYQFASIYRVPTKYKPTRLLPIPSRQSDRALRDYLRPKEKIRLPSLQEVRSQSYENEKEKKIEITTKVMFYLSRMTGPENASKSKKYREKEIQSRLMPGVNSYDGLYDEMYEDEDS